METRRNSEIIFVDLELINHCLDYSDGWLIDYSEKSILKNSLILTFVNNRKIDYFHRLID